MYESQLAILLDQNVPLVAAGWLRDQRPHWKIKHVNELGFRGHSDEFLYRWAQENEAIIGAFGHMVRIVFATQLFALLFYYLVATQAPVKLSMSGTMDCPHSKSKSSSTECAW